MRLIAPLVALTLILAGLIGYRLYVSERALSGPAQGSGEIEATTVDLSSRVGARIIEILVKKGGSVKKGDLLLRLDCSEPNTRLAEARALLAAAKAQAEAAGSQVAATQRSQLAAVAAKEAARAQTSALQAQREAAERQAQRLESIPSDVPAANVDQIRSSALGLSHQVEAAKAQAAASAAQARASEVAVGASRAQADAALAQVQAAEAGLARAELLAAECELRAPLDAVVARLPHETGELVSPGAVLVRLLNPKELSATFYLPNAEVGAVRPGAPARVVADAWPDDAFTAEVRTVALEAEFTPRNIQTRSDRDRLVYAVEVTVENREEKLRDGMPVQVILPGTERKR